MAKDGKGHGSNGKGAPFQNTYQVQAAREKAAQPRPTLKGNRKEIEAVRARSKPDAGKGAKGGMKAASKPLGYAKMQEPPKGCKTK